MGYGSGSHQCAPDLCLVARDQGWELRILYVSQVYSVTIHDRGNRSPTGLVPEASGADLCTQSRESNQSFSGMLLCASPMENGRNSSGAKNQGSGGPI